MGKYNVQIVYILFYIFPLTYSYSCQTPDDWQNEMYQGSHSEGSESQESVDLVQGQLSYTKHRLWPGGIVKYKIHPSLTSQDKVELFAAFEEYHKKTCIRFQPAEKNDEAFVSLEINNTVCGLAEVCRRGTYQFARFGQNCRKKNTMIHELGHTLCLKHEHQRADRDLYIYYNNSCKQDSNVKILKSSSHRVRGFYDYASQMHYECGNCHGGWPKKEGVTECGPSRTKGLSVLDAGYINELYQCQGCHRHRWVPIEMITEDHKQYMFNFGIEDIDGVKLFPCRTFYKGELSIGKYHAKSETCFVGFYGKEYGVKYKFEVLTIPGGLASESSKYSLTHISTHWMDDERILDILEDAVVAGSLPWSDGAGYGNGYIALSPLKNFPYGDKCDYLDHHPTWYRSAGVIGKVWSYPPGRQTFGMVPFCRKEFAFHEYDVLTCKLDINGNTGHDI